MLCSGFLSPFFTVTSLVCGKGRKFLGKITMPRKSVYLISEKISSKLPKCRETAVRAVTNQSIKIIAHRVPGTRFHPGGERRAWRVDKRLQPDGGELAQVLGASSCLAKEPFHAPRTHGDPRWRELGWARDVLPLFLARR